MSSPVQVLIRQKGTGLFLRRGFRWTEESETAYTFADAASARKLVELDRTIRDTELELVVMRDGQEFAVLPLSVSDTEFYRRIKSDS